MSMMRRRLLDDTVRRTAEGEAMAVRSVARMRPGLSIYGKSQQKTTTGAQLLNKSASGQSRGVSWQIDGSKVTFEGTTNDNGGARVYAQVSMLPDMEIGKTYYAKSFTDVITAQFEVVKSSGNDYTDAVTLDGTETRINFRAIVDGSGGQNGMEVNLTAYVAVTENKNMTQWEPYTGGQPSPNPDYPQEIESVGDDGEIGVYVYGGNLLENIYGAKNGETVTGGKGNVNEDDYSDSTFVELPGYGHERVMQWVSSHTSGYALYIRLFDKNKNILKLYGINYFSSTGQQNVHYTINVPPEVMYYCIMGENYQCTVDGIMLNIGSTALPFEPYKQPQPLIVSTPNGLPGIPVSSGGNYTDENGQQWISDEVDYRREKYVRRVIKYTGPYFITKRTDNSCFLIAYQLENTPKPEYRGFCNVSGSYSQTWENRGYSHWFLQTENQQIVIHLGDKYNTEEATQQFIAENEIVVYYVAETPIETDLTPEQITAYQSLHTNYPTTTVMNDEGAGMKLTYKTRKSLEVT